MTTKSDRKIVIICGISGAGCSTALRAFEDFHFSTVGRLPVPLINAFLDGHSKEKGQPPLAILPEIKSEHSVTELLNTIKQLGRSHVSIIFFDATNDTIVKRYSETRRPHPDFAAPEDKTLVDAIQRERNTLVFLKDIADLVIDTSSLTVHDLKREICRFIENNYSVDNNIRVNFVSFGFKYGLPLDCDLVTDVRFLPNPYFLQHLKDKTGLDSEVSAWVLEKEDTQKFISLYLEQLKFLIPKYAYEGKAYLNIGVGCTGGKHRSVTIAESLAKAIDSTQYKVSCYHRDINS